MTRQPLFVAIDGGGSRCRVRLYDAEGRALAQSCSGAANTRLGLARVFSEIERACDRALQTAGWASLPLSTLYAGLGLAGLMLAGERKKIQTYAHPFAAIQAVNDATIACIGAHQGDDGAILVVGTGSCGCAVVQGRELTVGGWGFEVADQGSGAALGREAVRAALCAHEQLIEPSPLAGLIMQRFDHSPDKLVVWASTAKPADYADFAPLVCAAGREGDGLALKLLHQAGAELSAMVTALIDRGAPAVALVGGLAEAIKPWLSPAAQAVLVEPKADALTGAYLLIREHYQAQSYAHRAD